MISDSSLFAFNSATKELTLKYSIDVAKINNYTLTMVGDLIVSGNYYRSVVYDIEVSIDGGCVTTSIAYPNITYIIYQVDTGPHILNFAFSESYGGCTPFSYLS